jgi:hypothetical protein
MAPLRIRGKALLHIGGRGILHRERAGVHHAGDAAALVEKLRIAVALRQPVLVVTKA